MKKLTISEIEKSSNFIRISQDNQNNFVGGGSGTKRTDPYTLSEYKGLGWSFRHGWVKISDDIIAYLTQNYYDYCANSDGYLYSGSSGYSGSSEYNGSTLYTGSSSDSCLDDTYSEISKLINKLPVELRRVLDDVAVEYCSVITTAGRYDAYVKTIYLKEISYDVLYRECVHVIQDKYNLGGSNHAALEFQEAIIGDLKGEIDKVLGMRGYSRHVSNSDDYMYWLQSCVNQDTGEFNLDVFVNGASRFLKEFQNRYPNASGYQGDVPSDYNYNWAEALYRLGIISSFK